VGGTRTHACTHAHARKAAKHALTRTDAHAPQAFGARSDFSFCALSFLKPNASAEAEAMLRFRRGMELHCSPPLTAADQVSEGGRGRGRGKGQHRGAWGGDMRDVCECVRVLKCTRARVHVWVRACVRVRASTSAAVTSSTTPRPTPW
jgi:hypothetical protein